MAYAKIIQDGNTLIDLTQDTVNAESMLSGITAHKNDGTVVVGTIQNQAAQIITPTTADQIIASGKYLTGVQTIKGDANLVAANIAKDVTIFGVTGTHEGGGGGISGTDVMFYDYDGSVVAGYSAADFASLTELPANPTHTGLTAQGWNWSLADAKTYVAKYGKLNIGQMYITDDGKTRVYIHLEEGRTSPMLGVCPNGTVDVDWGDGTTHDTLTGTSTSTVKWTPTHNYATPGDYIIKLTVTGSMGFYGASGNSAGSGLLRHSTSANNINHIYCNAITKVEIGTGVTSIGNHAFYNCYSLSFIVITDGVTSIGSNAFQYCYSLSSITIPDGVTSIGNYAFQNCNSLSFIAIPDGVTSIGTNAFSGCYPLSFIAIPDGVTSIGNSAFNSCSSLSSIVIPDGITSIGNNAFQYCYSLSSITIPDGVTSIGNYAFQYCYSLSSISIPDGVTSIGSNAFQNCCSLSSIAIPDGVTSIGNNAFQSCYPLSSIVIPDGVTSIGNYAFQYCYSLSSITIPDGVTSIGNYAFQSCYSLSSIVIPDGVTSIGNGAFNGCCSIKEYRIFATTPPTLADTNAFVSIPADCIIYVPAASLAAYKAATNWSTYASYMQGE